MPLGSQWTKYWRLFSTVPAHFTSPLKWSLDSSSCPLFVARVPAISSDCVCLCSVVLHFTLSARRGKHRKALRCHCHTTNSISNVLSILTHANVKVFMCRADPITSSRPHLVCEMRRCWSLNELADDAIEIYILERTTRCVDIIVWRTTKGRPKCRQLCALRFCYSFIALCGELKPKQL